MKRIAMLLIFVLTLIGSAFALEGVDKTVDCVRCGMDRVFFAHSRALVRYADGSEAATCSVHCAVEDILKSGKKQASLRVADFYSKELVEAKSAVWVVGGRERGVMTSPGKWSFARSEDAGRFVKEQGGAITPWEEVLKLLKNEVAEMDKPAQSE
ncbi:hypothetical protein GMLC_16600 [Geomonas limicola]|uniref:NosL family protein n=1 Tax=Geomonas limicola TaxID=2740186 RepID=A0A6V8N6H8_9BACT|nr:nitrous oxide reductase accessory protein NosL [Geomonas limicola]GFO68081.1 hypothetical protein GMLC_16600 [Geomonas limicola]